MWGPAHVTVNATLELRFFCTPGCLSLPDSKQPSVSAGEKTRRQAADNVCTHVSSIFLALLSTSLLLLLLIFLLLPISYSLSYASSGTYSSPGIAWALPEDTHNCLTSEICISKNLSKGMAVTRTDAAGACVWELQGRPRSPTRVTMKHSAASVLELPHLRNKRKERLDDRYF